MKPIVLSPAAQTVVDGLVAAVPTSERAEVLALVESQPVGRLFDGTIAKLLIGWFGAIIQGLTVEQIAAFLAGIGLPPILVMALAQMIFDLLHRQQPEPAPTPTV
jgi:hypothetical protein